MLEYNTIRLVFVRTLRHSKDYKHFHYHAHCRGIWWGNDFESTKHFPMQSKSLVHQNGMNQHLSEQHVSDSACERFRYVMNRIDWEHSKKLLVKRCKQFVNEKSAGDKRWFWDAALGKVSHGGLVSNRKQRLVLCQCQLPNHRTLFVVRFLEQSHTSKRRETNKYWTSQNTKCVHWLRSKIASNCCTQDKCLFAVWLSFVLLFL